MDWLGSEAGGGGASGHELKVGPFARPCNRLLELGSCP